MNLKRFQMCIWLLMGIYWSAIAISDFDIVAAIMGAVSLVGAFVFYK